MLYLLKIDNLFDSPPAKIAVAVSGGADSMCLTHILKHWCIKNNVKLNALIVDHGLRSESSEEASFICTFLESQGIKTTVLKWIGAKPKSNIQSKARAARYELLHDYCLAHGIKHLFVAHTLNDQAETVLMRIIRGSGIDGISAIKSKTKFGELTLLRPLLDTTRIHIENYMKDTGWPWVNDPSNMNHKYKRIKARSILNSYALEFDDDKIYHRLGLLAENARRAKSYLDMRVSNIWAKKVNVHPLNFLILDNSVYKFHEEMKLRLLVRAFKYLNPQLPSPKLTSLTTLLSKLTLTPRQSRTLMGCRIVKDLKHTYIFLEVGKSPTTLELKPKHSNIWHNLVIQIEVEGLTAKALGHNGWKKLKSLGMTKPVEIPLGAIHSLIAIYKGDRLLCVPHLNFYDTDIKIEVKGL